MNGFQRLTGGDEVHQAATRPAAGGGAEPAGGASAVVFSPVDAARCTGMPEPAGSPPAEPPPGDAAAVAGGAGSGHLAAVQAGVAGLAGLRLWQAGQHDLLALTRQVEQAARALYGVQVRLAGELHERGVADMLDARSAAHLLHQTLNITIAQARARVAAAIAALPGEAPTGQVSAPAAPELLAAIDAGDLSPGHARVITGCLARMPAAVDEGTRALCRATLIDQARMRDENGLRQVAEQINLRVDPDGTLSGKDPEDRAEFHIGATRRDGITPVRGGLSPLTAEQLRVAIEALAAPRPVDPHTPDPRPAALRREQALGEILHRHLTAGAGPRDGGVRPQVVVTIDLDELIAAIRRHRDNNADVQGGHDAAGDTDLRGSAAPDGWEGTTGCVAPGQSEPRPGGSAWSDYDGVQNAAMARMLACDAQIIPQVLGGDSVVLDQGRAVRLFTAAQRRAITTRDKGCAFPGCDIPPAWTDAHHIAYWSLGGATDTANGVLLCRRHHVLIHQGRWRIQPGASGGRPWFIPPGHVDPRRKPRRNNHFHLPDAITTPRRT